MLEDLDNARDIARLSEQLLEKADAAGHWPTRVDDLVTASKLEVSTEESPFSLAVLKRAPRYLQKAVQLIGSGRVHAILDRRERTIHIDPEIDTSGRKKFLRLHEVGHDILPWQSALAYADNESTLSPSTKTIFEREANQAAAELLFQGRRFGRIAAEYETGMGAVGALKKKSGASLRATLRRYAEDHAGTACGIYLAPSPCRTEPLAYRRYEVSQSTAWTRRFGRSWPRVLDTAGFPFIGTIADPAIGQDDGLTWPDLDSEPVPLRAEATWTRFGVALLLWVPRREILRRKRRLVVAAA